MDLSEDGNEALVVDGFFFGRQRRVGTDGFKDVIHSREREIRVKRLLALAVRVEPLAEIADALLERTFLERGKWEGLEAAGFNVNRIVTDT